MTRITVIGSMKYKEQIQELSSHFTLIGKLVFQPMYLKEGKLITPQMREALKQSIHKKIDLSDIVYVVNVDNYIGEDTKEEIEYARKQGKIIEYFCTPGE